MNSVLLNISVCAFMTAVMAFIFNKSTKNGGYLVFLNFILFAGSAFMTGYLIVDYENIISSPLNERLNLYETTFKALVAVRFLTWYFSLIKNKS